MNTAIRITAEGKVHPVRRQALDTIPTVDDRASLVALIQAAIPLGLHGSGTSWRRKWLMSGVAERPTRATDGQGGPLAHVRAEAPRGSERPVVDRTALAADQRLSAYASAIQAALQREIRREDVPDARIA